MNSRNRYASNPTYGTAKRGFQKKRQEMQEPAPAPYTPVGQPQPYIPQQSQQNPYGNGFQPPQNQPVPPMNNPYGYAQQQPAYQQQPIYPQQQMPYPQQPPQDYVVLPNQADMQAVRVQGNDTWVKLLMLAILPVLFVLTLLMKDQDTIKWLFTIGTIIGLGGMWFFSNFASSAKTTLSLVYIALLLMTVVTLFANPPSGAAGGGGGASPVSANNPNTAQGDIGGQTTSDPTLGGFMPESEPTPTPVSGPSEAQLQMQSFFYYWGANQMEDALTLCAPSWKGSLNSDAKAALFGIFGTRRPIEVTFEGITGTDADAMRTITITALIDKQNNREPTKYRFQVVMLKENSVWYVSPSSLSSNEPVPTPTTEAEGAQAALEESRNSVSYEAPTPTPKPTKDTKIYYNPKKGSYYHIDPECSSVAKSYLPLTSFKYSEISSSKYKALKRCTTCDAPERP